MLASRTRRRIISALGGAAVLAGLLASLPASGSNTFPGHNGKVAVIDTRGGEVRLGVLTKNARFRQLFSAGRRDFITRPSFSPTGKRIAFSYSFGEPWFALGTVNLATGKTHRYDLGRLSVLDPAFIPGGRIVFAGYIYPYSRGEGTYVVNRDGSGVRKLFNRMQVAVSADGRWFVAGVSTRRVNKLLLLDSKGRVVRQLVAAEARSFRFDDPNFSPDARRIVYEQTRVTRKGVSLSTDLFVVRRDGTHRRRLTRSGHAGDPVFSPNGRWIAFSRIGEPLVGGNIVALSLRHPGRRRVLSDQRGARFQNPTWARRRAR